MISKDLPKSISSEESQDGSLPVSTPDLLLIDKSGQPVVHALLSPAQEKRRRAQRVAEVLSHALDELAISSASSASAPGTPTSDTSGPKYGGSSATVALQSSLENRLRARMAAYGSLEYVLQWKPWIMPLGRPICALRASGPRTSDKESGGAPCNRRGWASANLDDCNNVTRNSGSFQSLTRAALLASTTISGWPTPDASQMNDGESLESFQARQAVLREKKINGNGAGMPLGIAAQLAGWPTPQAHDVSGRLENQKQLHGTKHGCSDLGQTAQLAGWPTPKAGDTHGPTPEAHREKKLTEGNGCSELVDTALLAGWPTPMAGSPGTENYNPAGNTDSSRKTEALISGWPTPRAEDSEQTGAHRGNPDTLTSAARLSMEISGWSMEISGWSTPSSRDWKDTPGMSKTGVTPDGSERTRLDQLPRQIGLIQDGSSATTSRSGNGVGYRLNERFSLWLMMGNRALAWACSAEAGMRLYQDWVRNSCSRSKKRSKKSPKRKPPQSD